MRVEKIVRYFAFAKTCRYFAFRKNLIAFSRPGSDLLSRVLRRSTIGAGAFHGRVRNGNGCGHPAITTRSAKGNVHAFGMNIVPCLALANLSCSLVAHRGAKACIRERMNMPCACNEKLAKGNPSLSL